MTRRHAPAVDQGPYHPRKGRLIGGSGCKIGHPTDCFRCPKPDCEWTPPAYKKALSDIEELIQEIEEEI